MGNRPDYEGTPGGRADHSSQEPTPSEQAGPLWLPARDTPPVLHCGKVERVMDVGDTVRGYLHYTEGCPAD